MRALRLQTFLLTAAGAAALSTSAFAADDVIQTAKKDGPAEVADVVVRALPNDGPVIDDLNSAWTATARRLGDS